MIYKILTNLFWILNQILYDFSDLLYETKLANNIFI